MFVSVAVLLLRSFAGRVGYPYDLEWMEGGMLLHGLRVTEGLGLYVEPSSEFIPFIYPPLYSWVLAAVGALTELGYAAGRSISLVGTLAAAAALVAAVRREGGSWALSLGGAGIFLSGYENAGSFYDLVRIDGLCIGLLAWSLVAVRMGAVRWAGILLTLAFATKHNTALFGLPALIWLWRVHGPAPATRFAAWSVLPALLFIIAMCFEGDGLFLTYLLGVPAVHPFVFERFWAGAPSELFLTAPWTLGVALLIGLAWHRRWSSGGAFWVSQGALGVVLCAVMRGHHGGFLNVLIPGIWVVGLWSALALVAVCRRWPALHVRAAASVLVAGQIWSGGWDMARYLPTEADVQAGDAVIARLAAIEGEVLAPWSPWYPVLAGKRPYTHLIALWDIDHKWGPLQDGVEAIKADVEERRWAVIMTANAKGGFKMGKHYRRSAVLSEIPAKALYPRTGWRVRPHYLYRPTSK